MSRNGDVSEENVATTSSDVRIRNRADPFLVTCRCFSFLTSLAAILCIAVNVLSAVRSFKRASDIFDGIFRCYAVVIAAFVVLAETEWPFILKFSKALEYWAVRGMLQIFVAVMTRAFPEYIGDRRDLFLLQSIASYFLLACGAVYVVSVRSFMLSHKPSRWSNYLDLYSETDPPPTQHSHEWELKDKAGILFAFIVLISSLLMKGFLCIGFLKRARQKQEITREQAARDLEELERRREELEQLLLAERV
ncbi:hypothetical protein Fmac_005125 [Flemingia macrophylla]|uniref:Golgi apparatus membrane protein TVP15 n=1 Tax=Flemingia macrophylla TaxID=520843 RepID=A0ABD1N6Z5_9FABA